MRHDMTGGGGGKGVLPLTSSLHARPVVVLVHVLEVLPEANPFEGFWLGLLRGRCERWLGGHGAHLQSVVAKEGSGAACKS